MITILITGSNGLLGQKLVKKLASNSEVNLIATARGENRIQKTSGFTYQSMDICNPEEVDEVLTKHKPNVVIHTAAMTNVDQCEDEQELCWELNVTAVGNLIKSCTRINAKLVHLSTDFIFDGKSGPYSEDALPNPLSFYGKSKLAAEALLTSSTINWVILRTILVYGIAEDMSRSNIVLWAKQALEKQSPIKVVSDQFRTPTLAEDLADACIAASIKDVAGVYHISGKDFMNVYEIVERVAAYFNLSMEQVSKVNSNTLNQKAVRPLVTGFILDKAFQDLDYKPHSFEAGIQILMDQLAEA